jgi:hypothetical protein
MSSVINGSYGTQNYVELTKEEKKGVVKDISYPSKQIHRNQT